MDGGQLSSAVFARSFGLCGIALEKKRENDDAWRITLDLTLVGNSFRENC